MDVTSQCNSCDVTEGGANKSPAPSACVSTQPPANGTLPHHGSEAPPPPSDGLEDGDSGDDNVTDSCSTNDVSRLLPLAAAPRKQKGVDQSSASPPPPPPQKSTCNGQTCSLPPPPPPHHHHHHQQSTNQKRLSSTSPASIKAAAGDDCCVHCLLACLFCEVLSMCSAVGECLACGVGGAGCCDAVVGCCCCAEVAGEAACTEEACQAVLDCGILENCCGSSECLEICLECCSICFPT